MKKYINYLSEIEKLKNWSFTALDFICQKVPELASLKDDMQKALENYPMRNNKSYLLGMQSGVRDIKEMAKALQYSDFNKLHLLLVNEFDMGLQINDKQLVSLITNRGKIENDYEYSVLSEYLDDLIQTDSLSAEIKLIDGLLGAYK